MEGAVEETAAPDPVEGVLPEPAAPVPQRGRKRKAAAAEASADEPQRQPRRRPSPKLDEIARKHAERDLPNFEPVARRYDDHEDFVDEPEAELDPRKRDDPTFGSVELMGGIPAPTRWAEDGPPRDLFSICQDFELRPGGNHIRVERRHPRFAEGVRCDGYLGKIERPITDEEFIETFGGIDFHLRVFGPDPRGLPNPNTGGIRIVPYTKAIPVTYSVPPVRLSPDEESSEGAMQRPSNAAEATIHKSNLDFSRHIIDKKDEEIAAARAKAEQATAAVYNNPLLASLTDAQRQVLEQNAELARGERERLSAEIERERRERERLERKIEEARHRPTDAGEMLGGVAQLLGALHPKGEGSTAEIERIHREHRETLERIDREHKGTLEALERRQRDELAELRRQIDEARRAATEREAAFRREQDERERRLKDDFDRREKELDRIHTQRFDDLKERHQSEVRILKNISETQSKTEKAALEQKLAIAEAETKKLERDLNAAKRDGDLIAQLDKAERAATAIGYTKKDDEEGERDWKVMLASALTTFVAKLPETISSAGQAAERLRVRPGQQLPQQAQNRQLPPGQQQPQQPATTPAAAGIQNRPVAVRRMRFASEDVDVAPPETNVLPHPTSDGPARSPADQPTAAQLEAAAQGGTAPAGPAKASNGHSTALVEGFDADQQQAFRKAMEDAIEAAFLAEAFARDFVARYPEQAGHLVRSMSAEHALDRLATLPGAATSPILRRDGRAWVKEMWAQVLKLTSGGERQQPDA